MSARGQEHPVDRVERRVELRPLLQQPGGGLLTGGHQVGHDAERAQQLGGLLADRGDLQPGEGAGVQAVQVEALLHGAHGVGGGERDPLVAPRDEAVHGALHLLRGARRLDRDGGHLDGHRTVAAQLLGQGAGLLLGARDEHAPAEQRLGLEPGQLRRTGSRPRR